MLSLMPPMKFPFQSRWRNSQLAVAKLSTPCQREKEVKKKKKKRQRTHPHTLKDTHSERSPSSNPLSLPIYPRHHPGSAPPLFFLSASLIIRQTHLFPINKPLSLRAGEWGVVGEVGWGGVGGSCAEIEATRRKGVEINTRLSRRVETIKKQNKMWEQKLGWRGR